MLFRKQVSKNSTECDSTDKHPRIDIVSDRLLSMLHIRFCEPSTSTLTINRSRPSSYNRHCPTDPKKKCLLVGCV